MEPDVEIWCSTGPTFPALDVAVVIGTYGDKNEWRPLVDRATRSVKNNTIPPMDIVYVHADTLAEARNTGVELTSAGWIIFLDADDELDSRYIESMIAGQGDLRQPSTLGVYPDGTTDHYPVLIPTKPLITGNYIVIGAMVNREIFDKAGGFYELPAFEDWELWMRMELAGAKITTCSNAIYRVHVHSDGRNQPNDNFFRQLQKLYFPKYHEAGLL